MIHPFLGGTAALLYGIFYYIGFWVSGFHCAQDIFYSWQLHCHYQAFVISAEKETILTTIFNHLYLSKLEDRKRVNLFM